MVFNYKNYDEKKYILFEKKLTNINLMNDWKIVGVFERSYITNITNKSIKFIILIAFLSLVVATISIYFISRSFSIRLGLLSKHIRRNAKKQDFSLIEVREGNDEIGDVIREFNNMTKKIKELIEKEMMAKIQRQNLEIERKQAEINALQAQINPHFLFNTLESIRMRCLIKNEKETAEIIKYLTRTLRRLIYWGEDTVTIEEEAKFIEEFLKIQNYRLGEKLQYKIRIDESIKDIKIPKMTIQPLIENACIHGIEEIEDQGSIKVEVFPVGKIIRVVVEDNGRGMKDEEIKNIYDSIFNNKSTSKSIGLKNVYKRLQLYYNGNFDFKIDSKYKRGTTITIDLPLEWSNEKETISKYES